METRRVTIKDVAGATGVTPQTVSRVFRGKGYVSEETRRRVLEAANELKYVPNRAAISLRTGKVKSVAVVFDSLMNVYFAVMVDYLQKELSLHGYDIQTMFVPSHTINEEVYRNALSLGVGAVISFLEPTPSLGETVSDYGVPLMILGRRSEIGEMDYIITDDVAGGRLAARRLIAGGCKSFGFVALGFGMTCVQDRFFGFSDELKSHGYTAVIMDSVESAQHAVATCVERGDLPDGIFCFSDMLAYDALKELRRIGRADVKVIGYDNIQADIAMPIELTTIGVDKPLYVKKVVELLIAKLDGKSNKRIAQCIPVTLYDGETA